MTTEITDQPRPATRLQPDSRPVVLTAVWLTGLMALVSFALGVPGLVALGSWALLPPVLCWGVPLLLDGGLLVMTLVVTVRRARRESARFAWTCLSVLTAASMAGQVVHVLDADGPIRQMVVGAALAATFPALVFAATHSLVDVAVAPPVRRVTRSTRTPRPVTAAHATPGQLGARRPAALDGGAAPTGLAAPAGRGGGALGRDATPTKVAPVTAEVVAEALRLRADDPTLGWGAAAEQLGVSKTSLQRRAKDAEAEAAAVDLAA